MNLPREDSVTGRGVKTSAQAGIAALLLGAIINLLISVWNVPGVPDVVLSWLRDNVLQIASVFGFSSGLVSVAWNLLARRNLRKY